MRAPIPAVSLARPTRRASPVLLGGCRCDEAGFQSQTSASQAHVAEIALERTADGPIVLRLAGDWWLREPLPSNAVVEEGLRLAPRPRQLAFDTSGLGAWDSAILTFLVRLLEWCRAEGIEVQRGGLPEGVQRLLALAEAVPEKKDARADEARAELLERVGQVTLSIGDSLKEMLDFLGRVVVSVGRLLVGRARFRRSDFGLEVQRAGAEAVPIVTVISFLVGLILAFVGAAQLEQFGATIYVANLVGVAMVRDMAALMTAIVMAGRSGAAYAAELGSMRVTQEIDALTTMGIDPGEFLVLPRILALAMMVPLLTLYADLVSILGGAAVGVSLLNLSTLTYFQQTFAALDIGDVLGGLVKALVYGGLVAYAGCLRGMTSGASASAVGDATTSAVVTGLVLIIVACGVFQVLYYVLGI